jgi:predicted metal-dependent hydrolase
MIKKESVRVIDFGEIGKVSFIRKASVRNLKITIKPFRNILVTVPRSISFEAAGCFVEEKKHWIKKGQARFARYGNKLTAFDESTVFHTREHFLQLGRHKGLPSGH